MVNLCGTNEKNREMDDLCGGGMAIWLLSEVEDENNFWGVFARKSGNKYYNFWQWSDTWGFIVNCSL